MLKSFTTEATLYFVGHSFGGINARLFTDFYPEDMLGIVLVDSTPENYKEAFCQSCSRISRSLL